MTTTHTAIATYAGRVQLANTETGEYDVHLPLPYPFWIEADGSVGQQELYRGEPAQFAGFQRSLDDMQVDILAETWLADLGAHDVAGMFAVFVDADGGMWTDRRPVDEAGPASA